MGAGRTEVMRGYLWGRMPNIPARFSLKGKGEHTPTQDALRLGIGLLPEERKTQGFVNMMTNIDNTALSSMEKYLTNRFVDERKNGRTI